MGNKESRQQQFVDKKEEKIRPFAKFTSNILVTSKR